MTDSWIQTHLYSQRTGSDSVQLAVLASHTTNLDFIMQQHITSSLRLIYQTHPLDLVTTVLFPRPNTKLLMTEAWYHNQSVEQVIVIFYLVELHTYIHPPIIYTPLLHGLWTVG